ncbi:MAG: hypothetical protein WAU08_15215 [Flavobacteriales bacterium]
MLDGAPSIDSVFLPLKEMARKGNNTLRLPLRSFLAKVNELLASRKNLPEHGAFLRDEQFALRILAIEWIITEDIDLREHCNELDARLQEMEALERNCILLANMRFALHAQMEVFGGVIGSDVDLSNMDAAPLKQLGRIQFSQFESALLLGVPNQEAAHILLGWMHASMDMEVALLMGDAVINDEVKVSASRVDALNRFLVNATQTYAASARLLGIVPAPDMGITLAAEPLPTQWVKGQKRLADQGLGEWLSL